MLFQKTKPSSNFAQTEADCFTDLFMYLFHSTILKALPKMEKKNPKADMSKNKKWNTTIKIIFHFPRLNVHKFFEQNIAQIVPKI